MILAILPFVCCSTSVVKILQGRGGENAVALAANGDKLVATGNLSDERAEFIINKIGEAADPTIEIRPVAAPKKKLVVGPDNTVRISSGSGRQRPWTVKREGEMHKLVVGNMCLSLRGRKARMEGCQKNKQDQVFMITSEDDNSKECSNSSDCEQDHHVRKHVVHHYVSESSDEAHHRPSVVENHHYEPSSGEEAEYVQVVDDKPDIVTDLVVKTNYKTVTLHTTSTVTSTVSSPDADYRPHRLVKRSLGRNKSLKFPKSVVLHVQENSEDEVSLDAESEKPLRKGADFVQNVVRTKQEHEAESDSSVENGLEDLIKVFNENDKHSGFIDIRAPRMFTGQCNRISAKK